MPKVSIVTPCLNASRYIQEMLDSLVKQTLTDIEMIIVDAGSTDGTIEIIEEYKKNDKRIHLLYSDKKSMGKQYNIGIQAARGEYIAFVESDDYIDKNMYERLFALAIDNKLDYVKADFDMFIDLDERLFVRYGPLPKEMDKLYGKVIKLSDCIPLSGRDMNMWNGIYRKEFLISNEICLNETPGAAFQDLGFIYQTLILAERAMYVDIPSYFYRRDNEISSVYNPNSVNFIIDEFYYLMKFCRKFPEKTELYLIQIVNKIWANFCGYYYRDDIYMNLDSKQMNKVDEFRKIFRKFIENIEFSDISCNEYDKNMALNMFLTSIEDYNAHLKLINKHDSDNYKELLLRMKKQKEVIIFGSGENSSSVYCFFRRGGIKTVKCFCDNNPNKQGHDHMNLMVYSVDEAVKKFPHAAFVITNPRLLREMQNQLYALGIQRQQIYLCAKITPHVSAELRVPNLDN